MLTWQSVEKSERAELKNQYDFVKLGLQAQLQKPKPKSQSPGPVGLFDKDTRKAQAHC
jgi:hypothetical protein